MENDNPKKREKVVTTRERIHVDEALPSGAAYDRRLKELIE